MIKTFFDTKIRDIVSEDFWYGFSVKNIWTDRNMIFDLFENVSPDATISDVLKMLKEENQKKSDYADLNKTDMLLFWLSLIIAYSRNENINNFCNQNINEYFSFLNQKEPVVCNVNGYFNDRKNECICFIDDCYQFEYGISDANDKNIEIKNTVGSVIEICSAILSAPEFYCDYNKLQKVDSLVADAENILINILYAPFFYVYETL